MIDFRTPTVDDRSAVRAAVTAGGRIGCEYSFGNLFCYNAKLPVLIGESHGCFVSKCTVTDALYYTFPVGTGDRAKALADVIDDAERDGRAAFFYGMDESDKALMEAQYPGRYDVRKNRDAFDYLYLREDLASLRGKKYQSKRNHISFFMRNNRWTYETITEENKAQCLEMSRRWLEANVNDERDEVEAELKIITMAFENYEALAFRGGLIRCDGRVVAYCMGEALSDDVFCVHFEKAFADLRGAYPIINQQFVLNELQDFTYVNREDDVGHENLRTAKLSYHPAKFVEKYETRLI